MGFHLGALLRAAADVYCGGQIYSSPLFSQATPSPRSVLGRRVKTLQERVDWRWHGGGAFCDRRLITSVIDIEHAMISIFRFKKKYKKTTISVNSL